MADYSPVASVTYWRKAVVVIHLLATYSSVPGVMTTESIRAIRPRIDKVEAMTGVLRY